MAHGSPALVHPVVHCLVQDPFGRFVLQLRGARKDVDPLLWDTSVGGHVAWGESIEAALTRELREELGVEIQSGKPRFLHRWLHRSNTETELVHSYHLVHAGPFEPEPGDIERLGYFTLHELLTRLASADFTDSLREEIARFLELGDR